MKPEINKITIELKCSECGTVFTNEAKIISRRFVCDCDYPCNCENGTHEFLVSDCPTCKRENTIFKIQKR